MPTSQGVQALDRYANVNNNPLLYKDPSGHCIDFCDETTIFFADIDEAQEFLDQIDALLWLYDHSPRSDLDVVIETVISIVADKITGDIAEGLIRDLGLDSISASVFEALGTMASSGIQDLMDSVDRMGRDENVAFNLLRDSLSAAISTWAETDATYMTISIFQSWVEPDHFSVSLVNKVPTNDPHGWVKETNESLYHDIIYPNGANNPLAGFLNGAGEIAEKFAQNYAPHYFTVRWWQRW